ncbi:MULTISPECIES: beta-ketoacyl synthase N-terminal-like domain-containing protein [Virgibacillus]|uniref:beta-ketoacyl synthase N-terminal-like domain-containing protein n=1 Tax=Virgibacillus TaxID=84406 RepID=UPI0025E97AAC|nr:MULTISPECIES: beta-ketoacyl synthase N-terminal-like domain-containing protein [Virgibacillus]
MFGFEGQNYVVNNACASGSYALDLAQSLIKSNKADIALVVSSDYAHPTKYLWLKQKGFCSIEIDMTEGIIEKSFLKKFF